MNKKLSLLLTAGTFALLSACGDSVVETADNPPVNPNAKISVAVVDVYTYLPIEGATVKLLSTGATVTTNETGIANFEAVRAGEQVILVKKDGYAEVIDEAELYGESDAGIYIAQERTTVVKLYKKTASLTGYLAYTTKEDINKVKPAEGATVELRLNSDSFLNKVYTAIVDATGKYIFDSLPAVGSNYNLTSLPFVSADGESFGRIDLTKADLKPGAPAYTTIDTYVSSDIADVFVVTGYNSSVSPTAPIAFTFSDEVDLSTSGANKAYANIENRAANFAWTASSLTVTPIGEWASGSFNVSITARSVKGKPLSTNSYKVTVVVADTNLNVKTITVAHIPRTPTPSNDFLSWDHILGATYYEIYYKQPSDTDFRLLGTYYYTTGSSSLLFGSVTRTVSAVSTKISLEIPQTNISAYGAYFFVVRAANSKSKTHFSTPAIQIAGTSSIP